MKQTYIIHESHPRLLLFFAGWGADETPFKGYQPEGCDYMVCYDYRTLDFDRTGMEAYEEVRIIGWSMGVWAASQVVPRLGLPVTSSLAINGTPFPIDEHRGIPPAIYHGTHDNLCGASLHKFLRRMCADTPAFRGFLEVTPRRPLEELKEELGEIERMYLSLPPATFHWQQAIVGMNDRIIPPANQLQAWAEQGTPVRQTDGAHYEEPLFRQFLGTDLTVRS